MFDTLNEIIAEFSEEEIATLRSFAERHRRWKSKIDNPEVIRKHRIVSETLTDAANVIQELVDLLNDKNS